MGALRGYDAQVDDARHTMFIARTAAAYGAHVAVAGAGRRAAQGGRTGSSAPRCMTWSRAACSTSGPGRSSTRPVCGPTRHRGWPGNAGSSTSGRARGDPPRGAPRPDPLGDSGLILRTEKSVLFIIPWGRHWIIGTTDTDWALDLAHPAASAADIQYLLDHVNSAIAPGTHPRGRRGGLRRPASAAVGRVGVDVQAVPRARRRAHRPGAGGDRGRQVHDVPGDGEGRDRRRGQRPGDGQRQEGRRSRSRTTSRCSAPRATTRCGTRGRSWRARSGLHVARIEHLLNRYGSLVRRAARR